MTCASTIILVHGLWMSGFEMGVLKKRLEHHADCVGVAYSYPSVMGSMADHIKGLRELAQSQRTEKLHFVGHSLGGIVVLKLLELTDDLPPGRAVLLGSPVQGSRAARGVASWPIGRMIVGHTVCGEVLAQSPRRWSGRREVGVIAGSLGLGLGRLVGRLEGEHDGTILVEETRLPGAADHVVLPVSHTGMLFSGLVAEQAAHFLRDGRFKHE